MRHKMEQLLTDQMHQKQPAAAVCLDSSPVPLCGAAEEIRAAAL